MLKNYTKETTLRGGVSEVWSKTTKKMPHKVVCSHPFEQIGWPKYTMNILAAHLNTSRATEMYLTILELTYVVKM